MLHYRPTIIAKLGERRALESLEGHYHDRFTPIMVIPPRDWDYEKNIFSKSTTQHVQKLPEALSKARGNRTAYIDSRHLDEPDALINGEHLLSWLVSEALNCGTTLVPVAKPDSTSGTVAAVASIARKHGNGAAIRVELTGSASITSADFLQVFGALGLPAGSIDLILDLGSDVASDLALKAVLPDVVSATKSRKWKSITVAGAGFPKEAPQGRGVHEVPRADWEFLKQLNSALAAGGIQAVDFSDYAVAGDAPGLDIDPKFLTISSTFRYTNGNYWLFARGDLYKASGGRGLGAAAVPGTIDALRKYVSYQAQPKSQVHDWFDGVVNGTQSGGNPTVWRRWATYHHIRTVLDQLSSRSGS
ncbi:beta family protein [Zhihengliuella halotolerans]|uniref:beta family protein n=1 Tax=Zhihengliuella halotolerans TaxID=370736 RepID=UPI000C801BE0|nr:hypothetical protein [Zhihengliuella halotolerans]